MDSRTDEPTTKRSRIDEIDGENAGELTITLNLKKYPEWVRNLTNEQLVSIFDIGLKIKEAAVLMVDVNQDFVKKTLDSQMEPAINSIKSAVKEQLEKVQSEQGRVTEAMGNKVNKMSSEVESFKSNMKKDIQDIGSGFQKSVDNVVRKASTLETMDKQIEKSEKRLTNHLDSKMKECIDAVNDVKSSLNISQVKGSVGELQVIKVLKEEFPSFTVTDTSKQGRSGDIQVETPQQNKFLIEVKNRESSSVPDKEVERFKTSLLNSPDFKVGILFSMKSGIANKAFKRKFEVKFDESQYQIYVPNAGRDLIVWSLLLAEELANAMHGDLGSVQNQELKKLYEEFEESKKYENACRDNLKSLQRSTESLTSNLDAILKSVGKTRKKLKSLLNND